MLYKVHHHQAFEYFIPEDDVSNTEHTLQMLV